MARRPFDFTDLVAQTVPTPTGPVPVPTANFRYNFATAFLDPDSLPTEGLIESIGRALKAEGKDLAYYPHPQGDPSMREFVADKLSRERGMTVKPDQIFLTAGSLQAVARYVELLTDPGDTIVTEEFSYSGTLTIMRRYGARLVPVKLDSEGLIPEALDETLRNLELKGQKAKFIYTIPTFQNPTGSDMGLSRRIELLAVAQRHHVPLLEDDCYADLRFSGDVSPAIQSLDDQESTLYCGSFSKILAPGMRLGFMVAPEGLMEHLNTVHLGYTPSQFSVLATLYYLQDNLDEHVMHLREVFRSKKDTAYAAVGEHMGHNVECSNPDGGLYLWVKLPRGANTSTLLPKAQDLQLNYGPGLIYSPNQDAYNYLRLCFGHLSHEDIREGIKRIGDLLGEEGLLIPDNPL